jgi:hypothetical protein
MSFLPPITPTGAMASGDYVNYMIGWLDDATQDLATQMENYASDQTVTDWYNKWLEILNDLGTDVTTLNTDVSTIKAQIRMLRDAISRL